MSAVAPLARRPLGCSLPLRLRPARHYASAALASRPKTPAASMPTSFHSIPTKDGRVRTAFAVYASPQLTLAATTPAATTTTTLSTASTTKPTVRTAARTSAKTAATPAPWTPPSSNVMRAYDALQIETRDPTGARRELFSKTNPHSARAGDVLLVTPSSAGSEPFAGVCLSVRRAGIETAILLRGQLARTGVERWYKIFSRTIASIEVVQRRPRRARRARLYYMRQPKHDRGSVDDIVKAWRASRNVLRTRGSAAKAAAAAAAAAKAKAAKK